MAAQTILVTGATGHLGAAIARELLELPIAPRLRLLIRDERKLHKLATSDSTMARLADCERVVADVRDLAAVGCSVSGVQTVIHACHSHEYWKGAPYLVSVNIGGAQNLVRAIHASSTVRRVVFIGSYSAHLAGSSDEGYQSLGRSPARECSSRSKLMAQAVFRTAAREGKFRLDIVSPSYLIGPFQLEPTYFGALFHRVLLAPLRWCPPNGINIVDVRDVARTVARCAHTVEAHERRILACGENISLRELFGEMNPQAGFTTTLDAFPATCSC